MSETTTLQNMTVYQSSKEHPHSSLHSLRRLALRSLVGLSLLFVILTIAACDNVFGPAADTTALLDGPIDGLTPEELQFHEQCDIEFGHVFTSAEGLGPIFNAQSCEGCHVADGRGHSSMVLYRFGRLIGDSVDHMESEGGPQQQDKAISGFRIEFIPATSNVRAGFLAPPVTGLGYLEAISDNDILAAADPTDSDGDGISGVAAYVEKPDFVPTTSSMVMMGNKALARFGRKATAVSLLHQTVNAFINDMGLSTEFHPLDISMPQMGGVFGDLVPEPEVPTSRVDAMVFYMRTLKAPPRRNQNDASVVRGEQVFSKIGCASCHSPSFTTGHSDIPVLSNKVIHPYSDLLLHDMGTELNDGYTEGAAKSAEWRTSPLWGLGLAATSTGGKLLLLHDGRAHTITDAILLHGGEGSGSRTRFQALSEAEKNDLMNFLESL